MTAGQQGDEPFTEQVLKRNVDLSGQSRMKPEILQFNQKKWKVEMSVSERVIFESVAGDLLETLGYETEGLSRHIGIFEKHLWKVHNSYRYVLRQLGRGQKMRRLPSDLFLRWADIRRNLKFDSIKSKLSNKPED